MKLLPPSDPKIRLIIPDCILYVWGRVYSILYLLSSVPKLFPAYLKSFRTILIIIDLTSSE